MKKMIWFLILLLVSSSAYAAEKFELSGSLKSETSLRMNQANFDLTKFKNIIELAGQYNIKEDELVFFSKVRYWYDAMYGWRDQYDGGQHYMGHTQRTDWLRDFYADYMNSPWFIRLGRQQVAWGQADGINILDRVNPFDLTEYWLQDFVDMRIPLWMANINYSPKLNSNLQFLFIPDFEQSTGAPPNAPFAFRAYKLFDEARRRMEVPPNSPDKLPFGAFGRNYNGRLNSDIYYPSRKFKHSKFGLQWQDRIADWEYTFNYLYGYDYLARTYLDIAIVRAPPPVPGDVTLNYSRRFKLVQMAGGSLNKTFTNSGPLQGITLRSDYAVFISEPTYYGDPIAGSTKGVNRWNNIFWLIGLDRNVFTNWLVSFQYAQYIMEHKKSKVTDPGGQDWTTLNSYTNGPQDAVENIFSLKIATDFLHERLKPEILWSFTDDNQGRISPKLVYEVKDNLYWTLGLHYFYGHEQDTNGQFNDQDQLYTNLKYTF